MKESKKQNDSPVDVPVEQSLKDLILEIQQQVTSLENKIDTLIEKSSQRPSQDKPDFKSFNKFDRPRRQPDTRYGNDFQERTLHKVVCAECGNACEVPFRPSGDRPVYCRDCFSKHNAGGSFNNRSGSGLRERSFGAGRRFDKRSGGEGRKFGGGGRPFVKKGKRSPNFH